MHSNFLLLLTLFILFVVVSGSQAKQEDSPCPSLQDEPRSMQLCPVSCFRPDSVCGENSVTYWCGCTEAACVGVRMAKCGFCQVDNGGGTGVYNMVMKLIFLGSSFSIVWYIRRHKIVRRSYDKEHDTFRHLFLILPCFLLALLINEKFTFKEVMWTFSVYLEAVAILPQLVLLQRTKNIDNLTGKYVFFLGAYRLLYILNWIYRYFTEPHYVHWITWISGLVQTLLYADFFYYYIIR